MIFVRRKEFKSFVNDAEALARVLGDSVETFREFHERLSELRKLLFRLLDVMENSSKKNADLFSRLMGVVEGFSRDVAAFRKSSSSHAQEIALLRRELGLLKERVGELEKQLGGS